MKIFVQDQASGGLFFEHNTKTCPPPSGWAKRPFMDGHYLEFKKNDQLV
jgi:hypothetical protein